MSKKQFKIKFLSAILYVRKVKISPEVMLAHAKLMEERNAQYPIRRTEMKTFTIVKGLSKTIINNLTNGTIPSRIVFGLVLSKAYEGDYEYNPFNFQHFDVSKVTLIVDGKEVDKSLDLDYSNNKYTRAYHGLFTAIEGAVGDCGNDIIRGEIRGEIVSMLMIFPLICAVVIILI